MNKMTKGALATGLGVALLVGGGGTLAVWNANAGDDAGTVMSGDLNITATTGQWTNAHGTEIADIAKYLVVPGDKLTFTQEVEVTLVGDLMKANLTLTDPKKATDYLEVSDIDLTGTGAVDIKETGLLPADSGIYTATVTVDFPEAVTADESKNLVHDLETIGFALTQDASSPVAD